MINTKLFLVLKSMNMDEIKRFKTFSMSPYHNTNKTITRFLKYVEKYFHTIGGKSETKRFESKNIFQKVYNNSDYKEKTFAVLRSQTFNLLEEFFTIERFADKEKLRLKFLAENYRKKNITRAYRAAYLKYEEKNLEEKNIDPHWTVHRLEILMEKMSWSSFDKFEAGYPLLLEVVEDLDIFYLHQKMRNEMVKTNSEKQNQIPVDFLFYEKSIGEMFNHYKKDNIVLNLYHDLRKLMAKSDRDIHEISEFRKEFEEAALSLRHADKEIIYVDLLNLVIGEYNQRGSSLASVLFDTYFTGIKNNLIDVREEIYPLTFYNLTLVGSKAGRFEEVNSFIKEYSGRINIKNRESTMTIVKARILEDKNEEKCREKIIDLLNDYNPSNPIFKMSGRLSLLRAYFMLYQEDASYGYFVLDRIKAFKAFLAREKKTLKKLVPHSQRFAYWLHKLTLASLNKKSKNQIIEILNKIENDEKIDIHNRTWLLNLKVHTN